MQAVGGTKSPTDDWGRVARPSPAGSRYCGLGVNSLHIAEPVSSRPAHFARLLRLLRQKGRSRQDAEDLIQEAMLHLHIYAKDNVVVDQEAFLRRAIHNLAIDQYRRNRLAIRQQVSIEDADRQSPLVAPGQTPDQVLDIQQRLNEIIGRLDAVNPRTREIYFLCRCGYTHAEIADDMGIAKVTVKRHMARALLTLRG